MSIEETKGACPSHILLCGVPLLDNPLPLSTRFTLLDPHCHQRYEKQQGSRESLPTSSEISFSCII